VPVRVLYATDGGRPAADAVSLLQRAAIPDKTKVTVVTVAAPGIPAVTRRDNEDPAVNSPADVLRSAEEQLEAAGFEAEGRLLEGPPGPVIVEEIDSGDFDLAVMGAGNRSRLSRLLLGSVSTKVLHASLTSVLIVHRFSKGTGPIRVLLGTDGSDDADIAVSQSSAFLDPVSCQITVLAVAEHLMPQLSFPVPRVAYATTAPTPEQEQEWIDVALQVAMRDVAKLRAAGFESEAKAALGAPAERLLAEADNTRADIVVVGTRGLGAVQRAVMGSVSDQMVREAPATFVARRGATAAPSS
jgi:nucleotide-binding universal stress UspA family protein